MMHRYLPGVKKTRNSMVNPQSEINKKNKKKKTERHEIYDVNKILFRSFFLFALLMPSIVRATVTEVSMSTFTGDFSDGGDNETDHRLLGNTSGYSLSLIQNNKVRVHISSGRSDGQVSSATTAGYVGFFTDGLTQFPKYHIDVWGNMRATGTIVIGTTQPVTSGVNSTTNYYLIAGTVTHITRTGNIKIGSVVGCDALGTDSNGNIICGSGGGGSASVGNATQTVVFGHLPSHVFLATSPFVAAKGLTRPLSIGTTFWSISQQGYTTDISSVGVIKFQIVKSTSTQGAYPFTNWGDQIHTATMSSFGVPTSSAIPFFPTERYELHIDSIPISGTPPSGVGVLLRGWFAP